jgi:hypothetical protein
LNLTPGDRPTITPSVRFSELQTGQDILITMERIVPRCLAVGSPPGPHAMHSTSFPRRTGHVQHCGPRPLTCAELRFGS